MKLKSNKVEISYVVPFYNEEGCVVPFYKKLKEVAALKIKKNYEMVFVNDGSGDKTSQLLNRLYAKDKKVRVIHLTRNFGQSAALQAGIDLARGSIIVTLDGDLQHDPDDIPNLVAKLEEGFDVVCGWRKERKDNPLLRKIPSAIANILMRNLINLKVHDLGTTLRAYRADIIKQIKVYSDLHRFIPVLASQYTTRITEVPINNPPRLAGKSKYKLIKRTKRVILDLITVPFLSGFFSKPMQVFGILGFLCEFTAFIAVTVVIVEKIFNNTAIQNRPLFLGGIFIGVAGIQFFTFGLIGEMMTKFFFETNNKGIYSIREIKSAVK